LLPCIVNSGLQQLLALADRERVRFPLAVLLAAMLCLAPLVHSVDWLSSRKTAPRTVLTTIEMRLVELTPPVPAESAAAVAHAYAAPPPQAVKRPSSPVQVQPQPLAHVAPLRNAPTPTTPQREAPRSPAAPATHDQPPAASAQAPATHDQSAPASVQAPATEAAQAASSAPATPLNRTASAASSASSGTNEARLLSQPMPALPDDLREQGYQVTAVAHFKVRADGTFDVELVKPTQNPRLNQILLETLHRWRFFPAMENGHPVESDQVVRVHFSVS
jgi:protein TonB